MSGDPDARLARIERKAAFAAEAALAAAALMIGVVLFIIARVTLAYTLPGGGVEATAGSAVAGLVIAWVIYAYGKERID